MLPPIVPKQRTAVVLDFDGVFFDSRQLVEFWAERLNIEGGIPKERTLGLYEGAKIAYWVAGKTHFDRFSTLVSNEMKSRGFFGTNVDGTEVAEHLRQMGQLMAERCSYPDAFSFCEKVKERNDIARYILSTGNLEFQKTKIKASGAGDFFKRDNLAEEPMRTGILITQDDKGPYIWELSKHYDRIVFADDKLAELQSVRDFMYHQGAAEYPIQYILVNRRLTPLPYDHESVPDLWVVSVLDPFLLNVLNEFCPAKEGTDGSV